jgi:Eukaryotic aspartyl protease
MTGINLAGSSIATSPNLPAAVLLDSGTTLMYLPYEIATSIYQRLRASIDTSTGHVIGYVDCGLAKQDNTMDLFFSGVKISVPYNEIVLPSNAPDGSSVQFDDGSPACILGISPSEGPVVLGDTFLRSAYVVYDLANNQISMAQTNFNSTTDNIREIGVGPSSVPDAVLVANPVTSVRGIRAGARLAGATGNVTALSSATSIAVTSRWPLALLAMGLALMA